jgi:isochorismate synthase
MSEIDSTELFDLLRERHIPFALYRLPGNSPVRLMLQYSAMPMELSDVAELPSLPGFLMAPFTVNGGEATYLLRPDIECGVDEALQMAGDKLRSCTLFQHLPFPENKTATVTHDEFIERVQLAANAIRKGDFAKVIVSKSKQLQRPEGFRPEHLFDELCKAYNHALIFYWQLPGVGSWLGATPEILMTERDGRISTLSLAGTQLVSNDASDGPCWGVKEIAEQAFVSRYIVQLLDKMGVEDMVIDGPQNFKAGNLVHLATAFEFDADHLRVSRGRFAAALYPTPAIAGLPRDESLAYIRKAEGYNRSYYSGLAGPVRMHQETHLYVMLRCMQLFDDQLVLYSGAGITAGSDPEKEWQETENKMNTLLDVIADC